MDSTALKVIKAEAQKLRTLLASYEAVIKAEEAIGNEAPAGPRIKANKRHMSAEARAKISDAQKKRWAKQKGKKGDTHESGRKAQREPVSGVSPAPVEGKD